MKNSKKSAAITLVFVTCSISSSVALSQDSNSTMNNAQSMAKKTVSTVVNRSIKPAVTTQVAKTVTTVTKRVAKPAIAKTLGNAAASMVGTVIGGGATGFGVGLVLSPTKIGDATVKYPIMPAKPALPALPVLPTPRIGDVIKFPVTTPTIGPSRTSPSMTSGSTWPK